MKKAHVFITDYAKEKNKIHITCECPFCGEPNDFVWDTYEPMANKKELKKFSNNKKTSDDELCADCGAQFLVII